MNDYSPVFEKAHSNAKQVMKDDFYFNTIEETAPFGSDDGADTFAGFQDWRSSNKNADPKIFLDEQIEGWGYPVFDLNETDIEKLKPYLKDSEMSSQFMAGIDAGIVAIAFGQLYLEGTIDKNFNQLAKTAIKRELNPQLLNLWGSYKTKREEILKKMLRDLDMMK